MAFGVGQPLLRSPAFALAKSRQEVDDVDAQPFGQQQERLAIARGEGRTFVFDQFSKLLLTRNVDDHKLRAAFRTGGLKGPQIVRCHNHLGSAVAVWLLVADSGCRSLLIGRRSVLRGSCANDPFRQASRPRFQE